MYDGGDKVKMEAGTAWRLRKLEQENTRLRRRLAEQERLTRTLSDNEATHRALLDALPDMLFRVSRDGRYLDINTRTLDELLLPPERLIGRRIADVLPPDVTALALTAIAAALETGQPQAHEYQLLRNGVVQTYEGRVAPCGADEALVIVRNVTRRARRKPRCAPARSACKQSLRTCRSRYLHATGAARLRWLKATDCNNWACCRTICRISHCLTRTVSIHS